MVKYNLLYKEQHSSNDYDLDTIDITKTVLWTFWGETFIFLFIANGDSDLNIILDSARKS